MKSMEILGMMLAYLSLSLLYAEESSPYGVCAHLGGGEEHRAMPENLVKMREAGIGWARADFSWSAVERPQGTWHFEHLDRVLENAEKAGIQILPILDYDVPWATPAYQHLDAWKEYVRQVVTRYQDRIRYWEVWNEQNLKSFWREEPNGANYARLLKVTYETIKEINPDLVVVYGGLAGVPKAFLEETLRAGAGKYFDVMNIHPYRGGLVTFTEADKFLQDIQMVHDVMKAYGLSNKPIWITEMGWATPPRLGEATRGLVNAAMQKLYPDGFQKTVAVIYDEAFPVSKLMNESIWRSLFPEKTRIEMVSLETIASLEVEKYPVLMFPPGEVFPIQFFDAVCQYVKNGGTLILTGGVPLYYDTERNHLAATWREKLRIDWFAWWTRPGTPEKVSVCVAEAAREVLKDFPLQEGERFFGTRFLQAGDEMIPLVRADKNDFTAPVACIYRFRSDFRGNIVVSGFMRDGFVGTNRCTPENQGVFIPQAILLALHNGIDKYFNYEFQAPEQDDFDGEHHFGIVHRDLTPKSGYLAYQALTKARPAGSQKRSNSWKSEDGTLFCLSWTRPDGKMGYAIWSPSVSITKNVTIRGNLEECFDYLGKPVTAASEMEFALGITYFVGTDLEILCP